MVVALIYGGLEIYYACALVHEVSGRYHAIECLCDSPLPRLQDLKTPSDNISYKWA